MNFTLQHNTLSFLLGDCWFGLQELAENEELFDAMVDDFFTQFDRRRQRALSRDEILPAMVRFTVLRYSLFLRYSVCIM